jgi:hypothetical protein
VASVRHLPEGDLRRSREENVLSTVSDQLHECTPHILYYTIAKENNFQGIHIFILIQNNIKTSLFIYSTFSSYCIQ